MQIRRLEMRNRQRNPYTTVRNLSGAGCSVCGTVGIVKKTRVMNGIRVQTRECQCKGGYKVTRRLG